MSDYAPTEEDFIRVCGVDGIGVENQANVNRARRGIAKLKADALRAARDELGVDVSDNESEWWDGYRAGQRRQFAVLADFADRMEIGDKQ